MRFAPGGDAEQLAKRVSHARILPESVVVVKRACPGWSFAVVRRLAGMHAALINSMTINPNQIVALLLAALLGNALMLRLCRVPSAIACSVRQRKLTGVLLILFPLALFAAGWEMYWNRSEDVMLGVMLYLPLQAMFTALVFFRFHRRCGSPTSWARLWLGNLLVLLIPLSLTLAAGEIFVRFFYDTTDSIAYTKVSERWIKRHYQHNKAKFRDNLEYSMAIAPGKRRVSFLGDSFTAGHGIKDVEDRFSNRIRRLHPDWEIHVLAGNGLDTGAELGFLASYTARGYEVDQVVLVYCLNDVNDLLTDWERTQQSIHNRIRARLPFYDDSYFLDLAYYRLTLAQLPAIKNYFPFVREIYRSEKWDEQRKRLRALRDAAEQRGGKLSVVTFPFLNALGANYEYQFVHEQLNAFWREEDVPHLDLLPVFEDYAPAQLMVNPFDAHPNEFANALAADRINSFLVEQMKTKPPTATASNQAQLSPQSYRSPPAPH